LCQSLQFEPTNTHIYAHSLVRMCNMLPYFTTVTTSIYFWKRKCKNTFGM